MVIVVMWRVVCVRVDGWESMDSTGRARANPGITNIASGT